MTDFIDIDNQLQDDILDLLEIQCELLLNKLGDYP